MNLLDSKTWSGRIFLDGWRGGGAGEQPVMEPATGEKLGVTGLASPADVSKAAAKRRPWRGF